MSANLLQMTQDDGADYFPRFDGEVGEDEVENGIIASYLTEKSIENQCSAAQALFMAIKDKPLEDLFVLNDTEAIHLRMAALVSLPSSGTVRLIYGLEVGLDSVLTKKSTAKKILALFGEGSHDGAPPAGLMLDPGAVKVQQKVKAVSDKSFMEKTVDALTKGIQQSQADSEVDVMQIAPVPAYLAVDAIAEAVPAGQILERLGKHHDANKEYIQHLKDFLLAAVVIHNKTDPKNELDQNTLFQSLGDTHVRVWSKAHFEELIKPPVAPVPVPPSTPQAASLPPPVQQPITAPPSKEPKYKWSDRKVRYFVQLCGRVPTGSRDSDLDQLPGWFQEVAEESDSHQQLCIIRELLRDNKPYQLDTANNPELLDYIRKFQFAGGDGAEYPSVRNACKNLSPYLCTNLTDTQLADKMSIRDAIATASYITVQDSEKLFSKSTPTTPALFQDFGDMLKTFANTIFALFGVNCQLYKDLKKLISAIESIKQGARPQVFTHNNKAMILWLTFLQTRAFFSDPDESVGAFEDMVTQLKRKTKLVGYLEMPPELMEKRYESNGSKSDTSLRDSG